MKISLSENITKYRKEKGLTQEQLADTLGVSFAAGDIDYETAVFAIKRNLRNKH